MSNTVTIINSTLSSKHRLESKLKELDKAIGKMRAEIINNPEEESSVTMAGGNYIFVSNKDIIEFALMLRKQSQGELDKIDLKLSAIGSLLGGNNE